MAADARYRDKDGEISRKYGNALVSRLRTSYGSGFAQENQRAPGDEARIGRRLEAKCRCWFGMVRWNTEACGALFERESSGVYGLLPFILAASNRRQD